MEERSVLVLGQNLGENPLGEILCMSTSSNAKLVYFSHRPGFFCMTSFIYTYAAHDMLKDLHPMLMALRIVSVVFRNNIQIPITSLWLL